MHIYTLGQWLILFFIYCVCGWIWESCYVSARQKKWVNRGFLHGPWLPIYGSGAIIVLFATLPVKNNLFLIWLLGMISATILEYITGAVIEKIFKVRYWDYSKHKVQLKGYICLSSSVAWGFFSILLIRVIHPPLERLLSDIPSVLVDPVSLVLVVLFMIDVVQSVHEALDLRDMLSKLTEENEDLRKLARRTEIIAAFAEEDLKQFRNRTELNTLLMEIYLKNEFDNKAEAYSQHRQKRRERIEDRIEKVQGIKLDMLESIASALEEHQKEHDELHSYIEEQKSDYDKAMEMVQTYRHNIKGRQASSYRKAFRILHGNPSAFTKEFQEAMEMLRRIDK